MSRATRYTYADHLALEEKSEEKHEYYDGEIFAMSGGTPSHAGLAAALISQISVALQGRPCRVFSSDLRVRVRATGLAAYPDVTVVCGKLETDPEDPHAATNPTLLVEVLSDSTEARDRGFKAAHYRHIQSLKEYILVSQQTPHIEVHRRNEAGRWELFDLESGMTGELASVGATLVVDRVYEDPLASP